MSADSVITNIQVNHARTLYIKVVFVSIWQMLNRENQLNLSY